jgi:hypothetical protein
MKRCSDHASRRRRPLALLALYSLLAVTGLATAQTRLELEQTTVTGARELPKVLYIVPWKRTWPGLRPLPMQSLVEELVAPLDLDTFRRQLRYDEMLRSPVK